MKKLIFALLLCAVAVPGWASNNNSEKKTGNEDAIVKTADDANETSMVRLQNKVIAGIETSINPGWTKDHGMFTHTLANFRIGYRLKKNVITGSLGVEFTDEMFMPVTLDYKYYFKYQNVWSPYLYGQAGYSWHLKGNINSRFSSSNYKQIQPGALASLGFGYSYTTNLNEFYFALGYSYRDYVEERVVSSSGRKDYKDLSTHGLAFTVGFNF